MKQRNRKITVGWVLIVLQCIALIPRLASGTSFSGGIGGFFNLLGFFLFGIVGVILLILGCRQRNRQG